MRILISLSLFMALFIPVSQAGDSAVLLLRGRVDPYTNMQATEDGVLVSSNQKDKFSIKLHKRGRGPASLGGEERTFIDNATLLREKIELIQIEAP